MHSQLPCAFFPFVMVIHLELSLGNNILVNYFNKLLHTLEDPNKRYETQAQMDFLCSFFYLINLIHPCEM